MAIVEGLERICDLTRDLRSVARGGEDREVADLGAVVGSTLSLVGRASRARLRVDVGPLPPVRTSPVRLGQVVLNLVSNALQATEENGGEVLVEAYRRGRSVVLAVRDRGRGIDPAIAGRLFQPFASSRAGRGGTGLGLYVVERIVRDAGGRVRLQPRAGGGTEALLDLPIGRGRRRA